jgi:hypothetical protein
MRRLAATFVLVWVGAQLGVQAPMLAHSSVTVESTSLPDGITVRAPSVIKAGREIVIDATLAIGGLPRPDAQLHFLIDGIERRIERTDAEGTAHFRLRGVLASGTHQLLVRYGGTKRSFWSGPASAAATFVVAPLILTVHTVPAMPGIMLSLDGGRGIVSDAAGEVLLAVARAGFHSLAVRVPAPDHSTRISFTRWSDDSWKQSRIIRVVQDASISVGLRVAYLTPIRFVGLDGNLLDPTRVFDVVISGPNAEVIQLQYPYEPIWLQTPIPAKHSGDSSLRITPAPYSLSFAKYDRLNVASTGQMRYSPTFGGSWSIPLLLFTLRLGARDAIFGTNLDHPIRLTGPTGRAQIVSLDSQGKITLVLGRGNYSAQVLSPGVTPIATIALSRSQEVIVPVITPADLILIGFTLFVIVATVFVAGRGRLWAFGRFSTVRLRYGEPLIQGFNLLSQRRSPQSWAVQGATAPGVGGPTLPAPSGPKLDIRPGAKVVDAEEALSPLLTSVASPAVSTFPRSYMLADDTALGQVIEVGLIIRGLVNSGKAESFLLLVHQSVMRQWQQELKDKFGLRIPRFERNRFFDPDDREMVWSGNPWKAFPLLLASSHVARRRDRRDELLAAAPWDVVVVDKAHEAHRSGSKPTGTPNKLLAVLQAMKSSHSWKALYLASATPRRMRLHDSWDLMDLLDLTQIRADVANEFTRHYSIPGAERPDGDWEFLRQMCADYFSGTQAGRPEELQPVASPMPGIPGSQPISSSAAESVLSNVTTDLAREGRLRRP